MSFHPNSMPMASTRPPTHVYSTYPGPGGMAGKPPPSSTSQIGAGPAGYPQMYFVQGSHYPYQAGTDGKYPGGGRAVPDQAGVIVSMTPQGMVYQGQHMPTSGAMILPSGQQVIAMAPPQLYQQPGGHQPRHRYPTAPPPSVQYGMGGGGAGVGGPMAQQQQPQQHQQQYYKNAYTGHQQHAHQAPAPNAPKRERKILQIVNPDTGKEVKISTDQGPSTETSDAETAAAAAAAEQTIAAQFAAQVAATLNPLASSFGPQKTSVSTAGMNDKTNSCAIGPLASKLDSPPPSEVSVTTQEKPLNIPEPTSKDVAHENVVSSSSAATVEASPPVAVAADVSSVKDGNLSSAAAPETANRKLPEVEAPPQPETTAVPSKPSDDETSELASVENEVKSKSVVLTASSLVKDVAQQPRTSTSSAAMAGSAAVLESSSANSLDNGNKKKNRKKGKELNSKGKVLQGSDMDAFIDGSQAEDEKSKSTEPTSPASTSDVESTPSTMESVDFAEKQTTAETVVNDDCNSTDVSQNDAPSNSTSVPAVGTDGDAIGVIPLEAEKKPLETDDAKCGETHEVAVSQFGDCITDQAAARTEEVTVPSSDETPNEDGPLVEKSDVKESRNTTETSDAQEVTETVTETETVAETATTAAADKDKEVDDTESGTELEPPAPVKLNSKLEHKYTYAEEQWSPLNPEGKKQYDRSFMLQLQFANPSIIKPAGLPSLPDIILNEPRVKNDFSRQNSNADPSSPIDFTPGFIKQSLGAGSVGPRGPPRKGGGGSGMKRGVVEQQRKVINVSLEHNITLHTSDNAWKLISGKSSKEGELPTEELYKKIRGILNKLTPQKFQTLIQQVQHLPINTEERLTGCIDIMFEKAISEPNFSVAYANMARCLMSISVPVATDPSQMVGFRKLLLNKCQQEFEKDKMEEHDIENLEKLIAEASSDEKRKALIEQRDATIYKAKRRSLGNIRFIGELFKLKMLTEKIMHECLGKLLKSFKDEDSLECLCQLLTTIGQDIDKKPPGTTIMNKYFSEMHDLAELKKTSSRIRFMIQDIIELRKNKWVPRRQNNNPKTIEQIHKEAEQEEQEKQLALQKFNQDQRNRRGAQTPARLGPPSAPSLHAGDDGWTAVGRAPKSIVDPSRMKLTKQPMDENFQLGPGGKGMSAWHRGSNGGAKAQPQDNERPTSTPNRFSALGGFGSESMDARSRPNSRIGSGYTGRLSGPQSRTPASRQSQERTNNEMSFRGPGGAGRSTGALSPTGARSASQEMRSVRDAKVPIEEQLSGTIGAGVLQSTDEGKEISEDEIEKKTKSLMDEYLHGHDIKEAALCVKELGSSKSLRLFVYHSLLQNLERSSQARHFTGKLHLHLVKTKQMTVDHYVEGLRSILEFADEMTIDIPRIWEYLGELISPMIEEGTISMAFLRVASEPLLACDKAGLVIAHVLHTAAHSLGHLKAAELWHSSGLKWTDFLKEDCLDAFLEEQKLQFTEEKRPEHPELSRSLSSEQIQEHLAKLLEDSQTDATKLIDWIDDSVAENTSRSDSFIRAFTSSLCSSCVLLQKNPAVDQGKLRKFLPVLSKCINRQKELEVQALFSLQAVVNKLEHPPGILRAFFDTLYDDEVISEDAFYEWKNSSEPSESAGRGVALSSVVQFFHWLENDEGN